MHPHSIPERWRMIMQECPARGTYMVERLPRHRKPRVQTTYRIPPDIERRIDPLIDDGEFDTRADLISISIRFYLDFRKMDVQAEIIKFLKSPEGQDLIRAAAKSHKK
jgi:Arc/MetJ-type ribon-helix-helix transcriptional regulator